MCIVGDNKENNADWRKQKKKVEFVHSEKRTGKLDIFFGNFQF